MIKREIEVSLKDFEKYGKDASDLNLVRTEIFDSAGNDHIDEDEKNELLKSLYSIAANKGIFFLRVMDRVPGLPKEEESLEDSYEESYEESYEDEDYDVGKAATG